MPEDKRTPEQKRQHLLEAMAKDPELVSMLTESVLNKILESASRLALIMEAQGFITRREAERLNPVFHVHMPGDFKIPTPNVVVNIPEQQAPVVNVAPPVVNVAPAVNHFSVAESETSQREIHVHVAPTPIENHIQVQPAEVTLANVPMRKIVQRDNQGRVESINEEPY